MNTLNLAAILSLFIVCMAVRSSYSQAGSFQVGPGHKFLNHPDHNIYNAYNMMDLSWWDCKKFNPQSYDVAKVKYIESFRLMGRIEATKTTLITTARQMKNNVHYTAGKEQQELFLQIMALENQYAEYHALQQELLRYQKECGRKIMDHINIYYYNQSGSIIKSIMLDSRSKYELGLADAGAIPERTARINRSLRNYIYGPQGQMIRNLLEMAGGAVSR